MLLVRSLERADRIFAAMRCRGFTGRFPSLVEARWSAADGVFAIMILGLAALLWGLEH
jgi:cobalt/nickel transport system permease protein